MLGLPASTPQEGVKSLADAVRKLMKELNMPLTIKELGIEKQVDYQVDIEIEEE